MRASLPDDGGKVIAVLLQQFQRHIPQSSHRRIPLRKEAHSCFAFFAASVVRTRGEIMLDHGVADHELNAGGDRNELEFQRSAIEKESMSRSSHAGHELVHDSNPRADESIFGALAELREVGQGHPNSAEARQGQRRCNFQGRGGTQSRADWHFAVNEQIRSLKFVTTQLQQASDAKNVVAPCAGALLGKVGEIELEITGKFFGVDEQFSVRPRCNRHVGGEPDGGGHDKAIIVVGVLADQIDAARGAEDLGRVPEEFLETSTDFPSTFIRVVTPESPCRMGPRDRAQVRRRY